MNIGLFLNWMLDMINPIDSPQKKILAAAAWSVYAINGNRFKDFKLGLNSQTKIYPLYLYKEI